MIALRSIAFALVQYTSVVLFLPVSLASRLLAPLPGLDLVSYWARFITRALTALCGVKYRVTNVENIPDTPCVVVANHQSAWETIAFQAFLSPLVFVVKRELIWIPFFGWGLAAARAISINRSTPRKALESVLTEGRDRLDKGINVCIFPEGTRMPVGETGAYNPGGAMLAIKTGAPVLPVAHNAGTLWPRNSFLKFPGTIDVVIGKPIETAGRKARDVNAEAQAWIEDAMASLASTRR